MKPDWIIVILDIVNGIPSYNKDHIEMLQMWMTRCNAVDNDIVDDKQVIIDALAQRGCCQLKRDLKGIYSNCWTKCQISSLLNLCHIEQKPRAL